MNILVIEDFASSQFGGAERSLRLYCEHLKSKGHKIFLVYNREGDFSLNTDEFYQRVFNVNTQLMRVQGLKGWMSSVWLLGQICRRNNIQVIVTNLFYSTFMLGVLNLFCRVKVNLFLRWVCSTHNVGLETRLGIKRVHRVIAVSNNTLTYWCRNGLNVRKAISVHNGVPVEIISNFKIRDYHQNPFYLLYVGRIAPEKGLHLVLEALALLKRKGINIFLNVAGDFSIHNGPYCSYHAELKELIVKLDITDSINFRGFVSDVEKLYSENDLTVVPSIVAEASSRVLISSIAVGSLVLVSKIGGNVEIIPPDKFPELHFDPNNSKILAEKIDHLVELSSASKNEIRKKLLQEVKGFTLENVHRKIDKHFKL